MTTVAIVCGRKSTARKNVTPRTRLCAISEARISPSRQGMTA